ncbi:hypothetical protein Riv7116_0530 [Rivularia sp. PCC 7116]|uniref:hypothetical protein n=1 Tax=Rivularia sp. PCC 7116 TaxID=373994 RepID=UPI00029F1D72|nr:hypothetical protein [Rivularia sp. PCC 7116]AFY53126.1 hypothetical protein Riv7116_0530 [Rivularia sp. PCC 7116]
MKLKDWKKLCSYAMLASGSTAWCCTDVEVVEAANRSIQINKEEIVSELNSQPLNQSSLNLDRIRVDDKKNINIPRFSTDRNFFHISEPEKDEIALQQKEVIIPTIVSDIPNPNKQLNHKSRDRISKNGTQRLIQQPAPFFCENCRLIQVVQNPDLQPPPPPENVEKDPPPPPPPSPENVEKDPPPLESQPTDFPATSQEEVEQKLDTLEDERSKRLERLLERLEENEKQMGFFNNELGTIRAEKVPIEAPQPPEKKQPQPIEKPVQNFKPVGYLLGRVGYFHTSNIFSSRNNPIDDGLIFSGLTLAAAPFKIAPKTYLNGSIDGNIIRYSEQSEFDYNQIRFNLGIYQQLTNKMYGEIGWNNQQLFYSKNSDRFNFSSGDKFLNENSFRLSVGRRDALAPKLNLDSFYEFRLSLTNPPEKRNRVINYVWLSLNYNLQQSLRVGIDYQFNLSNFLERSREDQYHRISANLKYGISELSSINLQSGFTLGGSTDRNIDFDGWFFGINYNWDIGQF